jgi:hypothetical protein
VKIYRFSWKSARKLLRFAAYPVLALALLLVVIDAISEIYGLPDFAEKIISDKLRELGLSVKFVNARVGLINGVVLDEPRVFDESFPKQPFFSASNFNISTDFFPSFRLRIDEIEISDGKLIAPLFPEVSDKLQLLSVEEINGRILFDEDSAAVIEYATCRFMGCFISASGKIRNFFPRPNKNLSQGKKSPHVSFSPSFAISSIPIKKRKSIEKKILFVQNIPMRERLKSFITASFDFDFQNFDDSEVKGKIRTSDLQIAGIDCPEINADFSIKNESLNISNGNASLKNIGKIRIKDVLFNLADMTASGKISGQVNPSGLTRYLPGEIANAVKSINSSDNAEFELEIYSFEIPTKLFKASISANFSSFGFNETAFGQISASAILRNSRENPDKIIFEKLSLLSEEGAKIDSSGFFDFKSMNFNGKIAAHVKISDENSKIGNILSKYNIRFFPSENGVSIDGTVEGSASALSSIKSDFSVSLENFSADNLVFDFLRSDFHIEDLALSARHFEAILGSGGKIDGTVFYSFKDSGMLAEINCAGNPDFISSVLPKKNAKGLSMLFSQFKLPPSQEKMQTKIKLSLQPKDKDGNQIFFIDGTTVISSFLFNDVEFDSGSCRFIISSDGTVIIPWINLSRKGSKAALSILYDYGQSLPSDFLNPISSEKSRKDVLYFDGDSDMDGDSLLKCFFPQVKPDWLDLGTHFPLKIKGTIDYLNPEETSVSARVGDASMLCKKIEVKNLFASLNYQKNILQISSLNGIVCDGKFNFDMNYDFSNNNGSFEGLLENSSFDKVIASFNPDDKNTYGGFLSAQISSKISERDQKTSLDGKGSLKIRDSDFLKIPILDGLLKIAGGKIIEKEWGQINALDAQFKLNGQKIESDSIRSNGKIIAFHSYGYYDWSDDYCDFKVRAEPLKEFMLMKAFSIITDQIMSVVEARYYGRGEGRRWDASTGLF